MKSPEAPPPPESSSHRKSGFTRGSFFRLMRHRNYRIYSIGDGVSLLGNWTQRIAIAWLTWELTHSGAWLGIIAFADLFPAMILSPIGGVIADRNDPKKISMSSQVLQCFQAFALFALTWTSMIDIWLLLALAILRGILAAINQPARLSLVPSLMPRSELSAGLAFNAVLFNVARFVGPAIAGAVIVAGGAEAAFFLNAMTYLVLVWALWAIDVPTQPRATGRRRDMLSQIGAGYSYVSHHPGIGPLLLIFAASTVLVRPVTELLPGFADGMYGRGAEGLAWMSSMVGLGAILGGVAMVRNNSTARLVRAAIGSILLLCTSIIAFAFVPSYWAALALLFVFGFGTSTGGISAQTLVQTALDDAMRGRVMSLYGALFRGGPAIGALMMGVASDHFGLQIPVAIGAVICLLVALWAITQRRKLVIHLHRPLTSS